MKKIKQELSPVEKEYLDMSINALMTTKGRILDEDLAILAEKLDKHEDLVKAYCNKQTYVQPEIKKESAKELTHSQKTLRSMMNLPTAASKGTVTVASEGAIAIIEDSVRRGETSPKPGRNERNIFRGN